jgi:hypothetical protein
MKRTANYKMSKQLKTMLALMKFETPEERSRFKTRMINAEIHAAGVERIIVGGKAGND